MWRAPGCAATAVVKGVEREPGARQKVETPDRTSSPTIRSAQIRLMFVSVAIAATSSCGVSGSEKREPEHLQKVADLLLDFLPFSGRRRPVHDSGTGVERQHVAAHEPAPERHGKLGAA